MKNKLLLTTLLASTVCYAAANAENAPRAVERARTTAIPKCTVFVDAASAGSAGTAQQPHRTIAAAVAAAPEGAIICVAEGVYAETLSPGEKAVTLAGGFQRGKGFTVRDSAAYVSKAQGKGGSFIRYEDPGPKGDQRTVVDGFEITGYSQAILRDVYYSQKFDVTNNNIHDNTCADQSLAGGGFALNNISGRIEGNVFKKNACGRGGAGFLNDSANENAVVVERNLVDANSGTEPEGSHGGALYLFANKLQVTANKFTRNSVTRWGGGLYVGASVGSGQKTTATMKWNVYTHNTAGIAGGGMFCDDGAACTSSHEIYYKNCGGNVFLDSGGFGATTAKFDHITNVGALDVGCKAPGAGVQIDRVADAPDAYAFTNAIFWGNAPGMDFVVNCEGNCGTAKVSRQPLAGRDEVHEERRTRDHVRRREHQAGRSAVRRSGQRRLSSEVDGRTLDANRLCEGRRDEQPEQSISLREPSFDGSVCLVHVVVIDVPTRTLCGRLIEKVSTSLSRLVDDLVEAAVEHLRDLV